jgi:hypothetical protein
MNNKNFIFHVYNFIIKLNLNRYNKREINNRRMKNMSSNF